MAKKATINDVAKLAGVSKSTVSRYLNNKPVKDDAYQRIKEAIEELNYQANKFARLSAKRSNIMGIILPGFDSTVTPRVLTAIDVYLRTKNYTPLIINTENDLKFEVNSIESLANMNVDGIIVVSSYFTKGHYEAVKKIDKPVVFLGQEFEGGVSILDDNTGAGKELGKYIASAGINHVGCLWVDESDVAVGKIRKEGIITGLKESGVTNIEIYPTDFTYKTSYQIAKELFLKGSYPKALICATDRIAHGVYKAAHECHIKIPEDVSVTGFGGYESSEILTPSLTTIRFNVESAAYICAETILKMIDDLPVSKVQVIGYQFIEGKSVINK